MLACAGIALFKCRAFLTSTGGNLVVARLAFGSLGFDLCLKLAFCKDLYYPFSWSLDGHSTSVLVLSQIQEPTFLFTTSLEVCQQLCEQLFGIVFVVIAFMIVCGLLGFVYARIRFRWSSPGPGADEPPARSFSLSTCARTEVCLS